MSTKQFQRVSIERLLISSNWRWYLIQRIVYCSHIALFYRLRNWGPPKSWGPLAVPPSAPPLIRHCCHSFCRHGKPKPTTKTWKSDCKVGSHSFQESAWPETTLHFNQRRHVVSRFTASRSSFLTLTPSHQRWPRNRSVGVEFGRILLFSSDPGPESKFFEKPTRIRVAFQFRQ